LSGKHITASFFPDPAKMKPDALAKKQAVAALLAPLLEKSFAFRYSKVLYATDEKGIFLITLLVVKDGHDLPIENEHIHVTLWCRKGVAPVNSNLLAQLCAVEGEARTTLLAQPAFKMFNEATLHSIDLGADALTCTGVLRGVPRYIPASNSSSSASNSASSSSTAPTTPKRVIALGGLPGTGKSTLARALVECIKALWINQDECKGADFREKLKLYLEAIKAAIADPTVEIIILDKINLTEAHRNVGVPVDHVFWFTYYKDGVDAFGSSEHLTLLADRIFVRGSHHKGLTPAGITGKASPTKEEAREALITKVYANLLGPDNSKVQKPKSTVDLDCTLAPEVLLQKICVKLDIPCSPETALASIKTAMSYETSL
jgi:hypothetical protein